MRILAGKEVSAQAHISQLRVCCGVLRTAWDERAMCLLLDARRCERRKDVELVVDYHIKGSDVHQKHEKMRRFARIVHRSRPRRRSVGCG